MFISKSITILILPFVLMILLYPTHEQNKKDDDDDHLFKTIFGIYSMNNSLNPWCFYVQGIKQKFQHGNQTLLL